MCIRDSPSRHLQAQHTRGAARDCSVLVLRIGAPQGMHIRIRTYFVAISLVRERAPARAHLLPGPPPHLVSIQPSAATEARVHQPGGHSHMPCPSRIKLAHTHELPSPTRASSKHPGSHRGSARRCNVRGEGEGGAAAGGGVLAVVPIPATRPSDASSRTHMCQRGD